MECIAIACFPQHDEVASFVPQTKEVSNALHGNSLEFLNGTNSFVPGSKNGCCNIRGKLRIEQDWNSFSVTVFSDKCYSRNLTFPWQQWKNLISRIAIGRPAMTYSAIGCYDKQTTESNKSKWGSLPY